jgi:hypothetical protein
MASKTKAVACVHTIYKLLISVYSDGVQNSHSTEQLACDLGTATAKWYFFLTPERKLATEEIVVERQNHSKQQERSIMASSSEPFKTLEQVMLQLDQDEDAILTNAYKWGDKHADIEIQANWPGAPYLMRWTREQNSFGGSNAQANGNGHELTFEDRSLGGTNAQASGNAHEFKRDDRSRGGTKFGGNKGKGGGNKPGCGEGSHSALKTKKETTQLNYLAYCASPT